MLGYLAGTQKYHTPHKYPSGSYSAVFRYMNVHTKIKKKKKELTNGLFDLY